MQHMGEPRRRSLRLPDYDYAQEGAYFVTVCTHQRACVLGTIADEQMHLSPLGEVVVERWEDLRNHHNVELDAVVVMPNHIHGVLFIAGNDTNGATLGETGLAPTVVGGNSRRGRLGTIIGSFKAATTRAIKERGVTAVGPLWQRGYYEQIVRSDRVLERIRQYIVANPAKWAFDQENPARTR